MTARTLLDGLIAGGFVAVMAAAVRLTLAAIGDLDHEARPVLASKAWLEAREKAAVSWWRAHRLPVLGLLWPQRGRHKAGDRRPLDEEEDDDRASEGSPLPAAGHRSPAPGHGMRPAQPVPGVARQRPGEGDLCELPDGLPIPGAEQDDLTAEPGDDWPDTLHDLNAEHLVPTNEPQASGPGGPPPPPPGAAGEAPGPEPRSWPGIDDTPDPPAIEQPQYRLDDLDARIEAARTAGTTADPQLLPAIRAALGFDSVDCYLDSMRRKLTTAGAA